MFKNRTEAGKLLADTLLPQREGAVVYALPRGGVIPGKLIADALHVPLDIIAVRKIGHPLAPEYAIGAADDTGKMLLSEIEAAHVDQKWLAGEIERECAEAKRRAKAYRSRPAIDPRGKTAIVVDDGIATGLTMRLAVRSLQERGAKKVIVAVPVSPPEALAELKKMDAEMIVLEPPEDYLGAVGAHYAEFNQVSDDEVIRLMK